MIGKTFGRWEIIAPAGRDKARNLLWECRCACEHVGILRTSTLRNGKSQSCGCFRNERTIERQTRHGMSKHPLFKAWDHMLQRCYNPNCEAYRNYGARGIQVCSSWKESFDSFLKDMLPNWERDLTLERINNDGNYEPANCKWATRSEQNSNRRPYKWKRNVVATK